MTHGPNPVHQLFLYSRHKKSFYIFQEYHFVTYENNMKFKCQRPYIKFCWNTAVLVVFVSAVPPSHCTAVLSSRGDSTRPASPKWRSAWPFTGSLLTPGLGPRSSKKNLKTFQGKVYKCDKLKRKQQAEHRIDMKMEPSRKQTNIRSAGPWSPMQRKPWGGFQVSVHRAQTDPTESEKCLLLLPNASPGFAHKGYSTTKLLWLGENGHSEMEKTALTLNKWTVYQKWA